MIREIFLADSLLWSCVWQSTIFLAVGLIGSFILRHRSSRAHQVLFLSMIAAVIVPMMSTFVKHYELGIFVAEPVIIQPQPKQLSIEGYYETSGPTSTDAIEHEPSPIVNLLPAIDGSESARFPWRLAVLGGWIAASLILAGRLLMTFILGARFLSRSTPLRCERIEQAMHLARARLVIDEDVSIYSSRGVCSPVIWCWSRKPVLLVPNDAERSNACVDWTGVLCHELAHWKRRDHISGLLTELAVCVLPWHPLLLWAKSWLISFSEQACDDWVVATGQACTDYAESLLNLIPAGQMAFVPAVVSTKRGLAGRIRHILKDSCGNPRTGLAWALAVSIMAVCLAVAVAFAQTRPAKEEVAFEHQDKSTESLQEASYDGDIELVKSLISKGADVNEKSHRGNTPIHAASVKGHAELAKLLISKGAYVNTTNWDAMTPLHFAALSGDKQTVELLLSKGAYLDAKQKDGRTPLFEAMKSPEAGRKEIVELLVTKGAKVPALHLAAYMGDIEKVRKCLQDAIDINSQENFCCTALHAAANGGKKDVAELLISKGAQVDAKDTSSMTPLYYAAIHNYEDIVDLLLAKGADVNAKLDKYNYTLLYYAIWDQSKDAIKLLISKGANVNVKDDAGGYTPLIWAIWYSEKGKKDMVELFISKGADVNAEDNDGYTPLYWAAMDGRKDIVELLIAKGATTIPTIHLASSLGDLAKVKSLIEAGADVNEKYKGGRTPLFATVLADNSDVAKFLIAKGADVNAKEKNGHTPLHDACQNGKRNMVELLISEGADVNAKTPEGITPLHIVFFFGGHMDLVEMLIAKGANVNAKLTGSYIWEGWLPGLTPLHLAVESGHTKIVGLLIDKGADINAPKSDGETPLQTACKCGHKDMAELLIAKGADLNAKDNKEGRTALSLAKEHGWDEVVELLRKHGATE